MNRQTIPQRQALGSLGRREFPRAVKFQIIRRATIDGQITCEGCHLVLGAKRWDIDHTIADALYLDKTRDLTADDGRLLGLACCHKPKTAEDVRIIAKMKRMEARDKGIRKRSKFACSRDSKWKKRIDGTVEARR